MRTATYLGLLLALAAVALAVRAGGGDLAGLAQPLPWLVVLGGTLAAGVLASTQETARHTLAALSRLLFTGSLTARRASAALVELARHARANGVESITTEAVALRDPFLLQGLQLVVERVEPERIEALLRDESALRSGQRAQAAGLLRLLARSAALVGPAASLIALLQVPGGLPGAPAPWSAVATALPAACDGLLLAGLLLWPLAARVRALDLRERLVRDLVVRGLVALRLGQNPEYLREALGAFVRQRG